MQNPLLTIAEVAQLLSVSRARAYALARSNIVPVVRLGRQVRVHPERLQEFLREGGADLCSPAASASPRSTPLAQGPGGLRPGSSRRGPGAEEAPRGIRQGGGGARRSDRRPGSGADRRPEAILARPAPAPVAPEGPPQEVSRQLEFPWGSQEAAGPGTRRSAGFPNRDDGLGEEDSR